MTYLASLDDELSPGLLLVVAVELETQETDNDDVEGGAGEAAVDARKIARRILGPVLAMSVALD